LKQSLWIATNFDAEVDRHEKVKKDFDAKYGLKDLLNNPWKLSNQQHMQTSGLKVSPSAVVESSNFLTLGKPQARHSRPSARSTRRDSLISTVFEAKPKRA
jgi:hypothetical protein